MWWILSDCVTPVTWIHKIIPFGRGSPFGQGSHSRVGKSVCRECGGEVSTVEVLLMYIMVVGTSR